MNTNKLFSDFSLKKIWEKLSQHDKAMNSTLLILTSSNWIEQEDGTFTNTVPYSTFKDTDKLTVDLYDDGTITETVLSEYEIYIDEFDIVNGALIATANTKPTQTMTIVVKGDFESTEINISDMLRRLDEMESNFTMAASAIGDALVAKEIEVPEGTSLLEMADIINNTGSLSPKVTIIYQIESTEYYSEKVSKGDPVLSPTTFTPAKSGWTFVGWRKDRTASSEILSNELAESAMTLYAVFEQTVTCTFTSYSNTKTVTGKRYYNNGNITNASVTVPTNASMSGWTWRGWSSAGVTTGNASVAYANNATISGLTANATYYGLYSVTITLSYSGNGNTGGSTTAQTGTRYWNASGTYVNPSFTLQSNGFAKTNYAFVKWAQGSTSGTQYSVGASVTLTANTTYYAIWDQVILDVMATIGGGWSGATSANQSQVYVNIGGGSDCDEVNKTIRSSNFNIDSKYKYITISGSTSGYRLNHARLYYSNGSRYKDISVTGKTNISGITGSCYISIGVGNPAVGNGAYWAEAHYYVTGVKLSVS